MNTTKPRQSVPQRSTTRARRNKIEKLLRPVHPNAGIEVAYRRRLDSLIRQMQRSVAYFVTQAYRKDPPRIAQDDTPAEMLRKSLKQLTDQWLANFEAGAPKMAEWFAQSTERRSAAAMRKILKEAGFAIEFTMTPTMRDVLDATINQNVALIKSIPAQYLEEVEGLVMRSVQTGRDLGGLTKALQARFGITRRRAAFIAKTQNNLATAAMTRARQLEVGMDEAIWVHSGGGHEPRPSHVKAGRERVRYKISEGWFDPHEQRHILPGELINCRCVSRPVVKGFS